MSHAEKNVNGSLSLNENLRAFVFYSGAFLIGAFWELVWCFIKPFVVDTSSGFSIFLTWFPIISTLGSILLSLIFGIIASYRQNSRPSINAGDSMLMFYGFGLFVSLLIFSSIHYFVPYCSTCLSWADRSAVFFFCLVILMASGYAATFFAMSSYFSNQVISKSALPFWSGLGQITTIGIIQIVSTFDIKPLDSMIIFAIGGVFNLFFLSVSWYIVSEHFPHSNTSESLKDSSTRFWTKFVDSLDKRDFRVYFSGKIVLGLGLTTILGSAFILLLGFGMTNFSGTETEIILDYAATSNVNLKTRLFQHICQVISSVIIFFVDYFSVKYGLFRRCFKVTDTSSSKPIPVDSNPDSDSDPVLKQNIRRFHYYVNDYFEESLYSHLCTLIVSWTLFSVVGLALGLASTQTSVMSLFGFAMTGFASSFIQSGREYQRSVMRMARHLAGYNFDTNSVAKYEFFDNLVGAGLYSMFIAVGQTIGIFISGKFHFFIPIKTIFLWMGYSIVFVLPLIVSCGILFMCNNRTPRKSNEENLFQGKRLFESKVILRNFKRTNPLL